MQFIRSCSVMCAVLVLTPQSYAEENVLATLRPEHPRLIATNQDFKRLTSQRSTNDKLDLALRQVEQTAEGFLDEPLLVRKKTGKRLLFVSRQALERITNLALAFHTTGDERFARRAEAEMLNVCEFTDWNPDHFLDVAEMATAVGLGYDWLHGQLSEGTRLKIRKGLHEKALRHIAGDNWWETCDHNWNSVCNGGLTIAALAIAEDAPNLARQVLNEVQQNNPIAMQAYGPDGVYPEGPGYWVYGTTYQVLLIASLTSSLGSDLGLSSPEFVSSGRFVAHSTGPTGMVFTFSDGSKHIGTPPVLHWFARETKSPELVDIVERLSGSEQGKRLGALLPIWMESKPTESRTLPLSWCGKGKQPVAMFRSSWTDPNAMYLAAKGGRANLNHGHMDAGSFVLEADGVRWAIDVGAVNYHDYEQKGINLFDRNPSGDRWKIFPYTNAAHNTLTIDDRRFDVAAHAAITQYNPLEGRHGKLEVDLSKVLTNAEQATRRFLFDTDARQVTVTDHLTGLTPGATVRWTLVTRTKPTINGTRVTLRQEGKSLEIETASKTAGHWQATPFAPTDGYYGDALPGVTLITWNAKAPESGEYELKVSLKPASTNSTSAR